MHVFFNPFHRIIELEFTRPTKLQPFFIVYQIKTDLIIFFFEPDIIFYPNPTKILLTFVIALKID